jgi:hypothetical protein
MPVAPLPLDDAEGALAAARSFLDEAIEAAGDDDGKYQAAIAAARHVFAALRASFPSDYAMPELDARADDPRWGLWDPLVSEVRAAVAAQVVDVSRKQLRTAHQNREKAKKPRQGRFPAWMKESVAEYAQGRKRPSPVLARDAILQAAKDNGIDAGEIEMPSDTAIRGWLKKSLA